MSKDKERKLPAVRPQTERTVLPAPSTESHLSTVASGFGASLRSKALEKHAEEARQRAGYYDAQRRLATSYKEASRAVDELNELDAILEEDATQREDDREEKRHQRELAKQRRARELADQKFQADRAEHGMQAFAEARPELKTLRKETLMAKERHLAQLWATSEFAAEASAIDAEQDALDAADNMARRGAPPAPPVESPPPLPDVDKAQADLEALRALAGTDEERALIERLQLALARQKLKPGS